MVNPPFDQSRVDEARGRFIREAALLEGAVLGAVWEYLGIEPGTLKMGDRDTPPEDEGFEQEGQSEGELADIEEYELDDLIPPPLRLFHNMSAELTANSKVNLLRNCLRYAGLEDAFSDLPKRLDNINRLRNVFAHAYGATIQADEWLQLGENEVLFSKPGRGSGMRHERIDLPAAFTEISSCIREVQLVNCWLNDIERARLAMRGAKCRGFDSRFRGASEVMAECRNCGASLGTDSSESGALEIWRAHKRGGVCAKTLHERAEP